MLIVLSLRFILNSKPATMTPSGISKVQTSVRFMLAGLLLLCSAAPVFAQTSNIYPNGSNFGEAQYVMCEYNPNSLYTNGSTMMVSTNIASGSSEPTGLIFRILDPTGSVLLQRMITGDGVGGVEPRAVCYRRGATADDDRYAIVGHCRVCGAPNNIYKNWIIILDFKGNIVATNTVWVYGMTGFDQSFNQPMTLPRCTAIRIWVDISLPASWERLTLATIRTKQSPPLPGHSICPTGQASSCG